jgi:hypothetical protein
VSWCARARRYGFAAPDADAESQADPFATGSVAGDSFGLLGAPEGAPAEPDFTTAAERTTRGPDTYFGENVFHHEASPENHPSVAGGCPFPSYAGDGMAV